MPSLPSLPLLPFTGLPRGRTFARRGDCRNNAEEEDQLQEEQRVIIPLYGPEEAVRGGLSTRLGGVSQGRFATLNLGTSTDDEPTALATNRRRFAAAAGIDLDAAARMRQIHGGHVEIAREAGCVGQADGLVTAVAGLPLLVTVADCLPVFLHEPAAGLVGALHAGWRGVLAGVLEAGVERVRELGGQPARLEVRIGPAIGPCCFEVGPEVAGRFAAAERSTIGGRPHVDLALAARRRLAAAGVPPTAVRPPAHCTRCRNDLFFSARGGEPTGRMVGFIVRHGPCQGILRALT